LHLAQRCRRWVAEWSRISRPVGCRKCSKAISPGILRGRPRSVTSQASDVHKREISINPFDCPRDTSPAALWIDAEKIVSKQFPDMAGEVKWPDTKRHISIFAKLRFIHKELDLACSLRETQRWYGIVSRHRNELFHGASSARPSAEHIMEALNALDLLEKNFRLKEAGEGQQ
jgi:hypothetical protein